MKSYEVKISPLDNYKYSFKSQSYYTHANSSSQACNNLIVRDGYVKSLYTKGLCKLEANIQKQKNIQKTTQENLIEFMKQNYSDIVRHEKQYEDN